MTRTIYDNNVNLINKGNKRERKNNKTLSKKVQNLIDKSTKKRENRHS
jgi:hypothetical protein